MNRLAVGALLPMFLWSCHTEQYHEKTDELVEVPDGFTISGGAQRVGFCSEFGDPALDETVELALTQNFDLQASWARLSQASALSKQANASLFPTVTADASASRSRSPAGPPVNAVESDSFRVSAGAAYELDLWGRLHHNRKAAKVEIDASRADFETMNISVANQVYAAWFDIASTREKIDLLESQIEISESFLELTILRFEQGISDALDVTQQRQQVESLRGQLELLRARERVAQTQIAVLVARAPNQVLEVGTSKLPTVPELPDVGIPSAILDNRPDVRASLLRILSADHRTKAAIGQALPSIRLSANVFLQAANIGDLIDEIFWSVTGAVSQSVFGGGRILAEKESAESAARAQLYAFGQTYLRALKEVEDALILEQQQVAFIESLAKQLADAETGLKLARQRYQAGAGTYLRVLTALQSVQQLEQSRVDAHRTHLTHRLSLCRALGGQWVKDRTMEPPSNESQDK